MVDEFRTSSQPYMEWVAAHPHGYVINIQRSLNLSGARLHRADCPTITGAPARGQGFVGTWIKICSDSPDSLASWALSQAGGTVRGCGTCQPADRSAAGQSLAALAGEPPGRDGPDPSPLMGSRHEFDGPEGATREVCFWADRYIPFEKLSAGQLAARTELRQRLALLSAGPGEILHASYLAPKRSDMDLENLLLYNIGGSCFRPAARYGVRFELARRAGRLAPSGKSYSCCCRYRAAPAEQPSPSWRGIGLLASFAGAELGSFPDHKRLAQTWLAVRQCADVVVARRADVRQPFAVLLRLRLPAGGAAWPSPDLTKPLIDGVVAAFQAHGDTAAVGEAASRIGRDIDQDAGLVVRLLTGTENAVLAADSCLVRLRGSGVMWNPADHQCVLGELLIEEGGQRGGRLSGELHALEPRQ